jgi:2-amino-4-hydroxy-6-hydroxymethyldihydropteridine diphosphokinase
LSEESVFLSLGSNLGRRENNLLAAVAALECCVEKIRCSSIYETRPMYFLDQPKFLNMVISGACALEPVQLLRQILGIEFRLGRDRSAYIPNGPRIIDIDILLFGRRIVKRENLRIPHPRIKERQFVLIPILELEPDLVDPETGIPLSESLRGLEDQGVYIFKA